ncbi:RNase NYN domain-containing protein [Balamuthia mandrillaris]
MQRPRGAQSNVHRQRNANNMNTKKQIPRWRPQATSNNGDVRGKDRPQKLLFVDILNYTTMFFRTSAAWPTPQAAFRQVQQFVKAARQSGWTLELFIDDRIQTTETEAKWRKRREKEIRMGTRRVPQGANRLLGDMFAHLRVPIHYSHEADNDDTIVAHAFARSAAILSADRDMYRYTGISPPLRVFESYSVVRTAYPPTLELFERPPSDRNSRSSPRAVLVPPPATNSTMQADWGQIKEGIIYERGSPSPLTRHFGNLHLTVRPLRQAVYHRLRITGTVHEIIPEWDELKGTVRWTDDHVEPDPGLAHLLDGAPSDAIAYLFPDLADASPGQCAAAHKDIPPKLMYNHLWAIRAVVYELLVIASRDKRRSLLNLMEDDPLFPSGQRGERGGWGGGGGTRGRGGGRGGGKEGGRWRDRSQQGHQEGKATNS